MIPLLKFISIHKYHALSLILLVCGCVLFGSLIFSDNLWLDEIYTLAEVNASYSSLIHVFFTETHPPLYFLALKLFSDIFGYSTITAHFFSLLGCLATMLLGIFPIRKAFGDRVSLIFLFLCLTMPFMMWYSHEIRMYSWAMFLVLASFVYAVRVIQTNDTGCWILFTVFSIAGTYIHYYAIMSVALIVVFLGSYLWMKKRDIIWKWFISTGTICLAFLPFLPMLYSQVSGVNDGFWITFSPMSLVLIPYSIFTLHSTISILNTVFVVFIGCVSLGLLYKMFTTKPWTNNEIIALSCVVIITIVLLFTTLYSLLVQPVIQARYIMIMACLGLLFFSIMLSKIQNKIILTVFIVVMLASTGVSYYSNYQSEYNGELTEVMDSLTSSLPDDSIIIYDESHSYGVCGYYLKMFEHLFVVDEITDKTWSHYYASLLNGDAVTISDVTALLSNETNVYILEAGDNDIQPILSNTYEIKQISEYFTPSDNYKKWTLYSVEKKFTDTVITFL